MCVCVRAIRLEFFIIVMINGSAHELVLHHLSRLFSFHIAVTLSKKRDFILVVAKHQPPRVFAS